MPAKTALAPFAMTTQMQKMLETLVDELGPAGVVEALLETLTTAPAAVRGAAQELIAEMIAAEQDA